MSSGLAVTVPLPPTVDPVVGVWRRHGLGECAAVSDEFDIKSKKGSGTTVKSIIYIEDKAS